MAFQTTVADAPDAAFAGQLQHQFPFATESAVAEGAGIVAGGAVLAGTTAPQVKAIEDGDTVSSTNFLGLVLLETSRAYSGIEDKSPVTILRKGRMSLSVTGTVAARTQVHVGNAEATLGKFGPAGADYVALPGVYFVESGTDTTVIVEIDLPA